MCKETNEGCKTTEGKKCPCCRLLKIALWTVAVVAVVLLALPLWIGPVATGVANAVAPMLTGTEFHLEEFGLNPYTGKLRIAGCRLGNPPGFQEKDAFTLESLSLDVSFLSLLTSKIHVRDIVIEKPYVCYLSEGGTNNFDYVLAHLMGDKKDKEVEEKAEESGQEKRFVIDHFRLSGTRVKLGAMPALPIPTIDLSGLGSDKEDGATFSELVQIIWEKIQKSFSSVSEGILSLTNGLTNSVSGDAAKSATDAVGNAAKGATDAVGNAAKALGGLFGGSK